MPAATAAAEPPLLPPGARCKSQGFCVVKNAECSVEDPMANSSMLVLPTMTAPAAFSRSITVASKGGLKSLSMFEPQVVVMPCVQITSLIARGIPVSGETVEPFWKRRSASFACCMARSSVTRVKALTLSSMARMRSRCARVNSTEEILRARSSSPASCMLSLYNSVMIKTPPTPREF